MPMTQQSPPPPVALIPVPEHVPSYVPAAGLRPLPEPPRRTSTALDESGVEHMAVELPADSLAYQWTKARAAPKGGMDWGGHPGNEDNGKHTPAVHNHGPPPVVADASVSFRCGALGPSPADNADMAARRRHPSFGVAPPPDDVPGAAVSLVVRSPDDRGEGQTIRRIRTIGRRPPAGDEPASVQTHPPTMPWVALKRFTVDLHPRPKPKALVSGYRLEGEADPPRRRTRRRATASPFHPLATAPHYGGFPFAAYYPALSPPTQTLTSRSRACPRRHRQHRRSATYPHAQSPPGPSAAAALRTNSAGVFHPAHRLRTLRTGHLARRRLYWLGRLYMQTTGSARATPGSSPPGDGNEPAGSQMLISGTGQPAFAPGPQPGGGAPFAFSPGALWRWEWRSMGSNPGPVSSSGYVVESASLLTSIVSRFFDGDKTRARTEHRRGGDNGGTKYTQRWRRWKRFRGGKTRGRARAGGLCLPSEGGVTETGRTSLLKGATEARFQLAVLIIRTAEQDFSSALHFRRGKRCKLSGLAYLTV
ncbi:hypothetical protein C8R47DRAFT_1239812 [Mycena vitilis]|nr:hypothetical protein C8R47DRAFT_1239812 [Mycena vitilis]